MEGMETKLVFLIPVSLPTDDPLFFISSFLDYRDLINCSNISQSLSQLSSHDLLWKRHCKKQWPISEEDKTQKSQYWQFLFIDTCFDVGRYKDHNDAIKKAWDGLKKYLNPDVLRWLFSKRGWVIKKEDIEALVQSLGREDPLEGTATHSSILAWRISPGRPQSMGHKDSNTIEQFSKQAIDAVEAQMSCKLPDYHP